MLQCKLYVGYHLRLTKNLLYREKSSGQSNMLIFGKYEPWGNLSLIKLRSFALIVCTLAVDIENCTDFVCNVPWSIFICERKRIWGTSSKTDHLEVISPYVYIYRFTKLKTEASLLTFLQHKTCTVNWCHWDYLQSVSLVHGAVFVIMHY